MFIDFYCALVVYSSISLVILENERSPPTLVWCQLFIRDARIHRPGKGLFRSNNPVACCSVTLKQFVHAPAIRNKNSFWIQTKLNQITKDKDRQANFFSQETLFKVELLKGILDLTTIFFTLDSQNKSIFIYYQWWLSNPKIIDFSIQQKEKDKCWMIVLTSFMWKTFLISELFLRLKTIFYRWHIAHAIKIRVNSKNT